MTTATTLDSNASSKERRVSERRRLLKVEAHNDNPAPTGSPGSQAPACGPGAEDRFDFTGLAEDERAFEDGPA